MSDQMTHEISKSNIEVIAKPLDFELKKLPDNESSSRDNDKIKSLMAEELIEIGLSKKTAYQILNIETE